MSEKAPVTKGPLEVLHQSRVEEDEIDELGHLSVPFYEQRALTASRKLLTSRGVDIEALENKGLDLTLVDTFTRNYREQFLGAPLEVRGGVLDVDDGQVRLYQEIINTERGELSAVFVHRWMLQATDSRRPVAFDDAVVHRMAAARVAWPEHGQPRSLDLSGPPFRLELAEARRRNLQSREAHPVPADQCSSAGVLDPTRFQHLPYIGASLEDPTMQWVFKTPDGNRVGLADLESRTTLFVLPRSGDSIQTFSADVEIARKTIRRSHWVFNVDSGELLTCGSVVMACLDLDARRAIEISGGLREMFDRRYHPDLR